MSEVLRSGGENTPTALWLQRVPGQKPYLVSCSEMDDLAEPKGDVTLSLCRDANGKLKTVGRGRGVPGAPTTGFETWIFPEKSILDDVLKSSCSLILYALSKTCGRADEFTGSARARIAINFTPTDNTESNLVSRSESVEQAVKVSGVADIPISRTRAVKVTRQDIGETAGLTDIAFCNDARCAGACGNAQDAGVEGFVVSEAPAGSPTAEADVWGTADEGVTWTNDTPYSVHPFDAGEDIASGVCFKVDSNTTRKLVARAPVGGEPAQIAYSDDDWVTRTQVSVGATNNEGANGHGALFALDKYHIWYATDAGNVYFSEDGAVTWTLQASATASGGNALNMISFANGDPDHGYAVGENGTIIETTDGGDTWSAITDPSGGDDFTAVHVFDQFRMIAGTNVGGVWQSWNEGVSFTEQSGYPDYAATNTIQDIRFYNEVVGYMLVNTNAPVGKVYRSINGGYDMEKLTVPTNAGLNALAVIDENLAYAAGNAQGGTAVVLKISG